MSDMITRPLFALLLTAALALPATGQEQTGTVPAPQQGEAPGDADPATGDPAGGGTLSTGEAVAEPAPRGPRIYVREEHGDWEIRCLEAPEGQPDPCQMYQRLSDQSGNPTADINVFDLPDGGEIAAGATILTPLQTLLTEQVTLSIDGGQPRRYPFSFCDEAGCYARLGLTADDVNRMRRGADGTVVVVPAQAPDQEARLTLSLTGFTAGYEAITVENQ
jgi:invasion protein IalB